MTPGEVEALGLTTDEIGNLLAGFTEETVVVGSRAQPRTVTASPVPVDVLSTTELTSQGPSTCRINSGRSSRRSPSTLNRSATPPP